MRKIIMSVVAVCVFVSTLYGVQLPGNWDRLTCRVETKLDSGVISGTGFLLRYEGRIFIVTNKHVVRPGSTSFTLPLKIVPSDSINAEAGTYLPMTPSAGMYFWDKQYDLAFVDISKFAGALDVTVIPESMVGEDSMIVIGQGVVFIGYPGGLHGREANVPLVRGGIIAGEKDHLIILDGNVFGGSSGSPVFLNPSILNGQINGNWLIGIISSSAALPLRADTSLKENMGVGFAIKISYLRSTIMNWLREQQEVNTTGDGK